MTHVEINDDGAWVVGTFPAGSGVWYVETYDPTIFEDQTLLDHFEVDATLVDVPFDQVLRIVRPGCGQVDVRRWNSHQPTGGADLVTDTCVTAPPTTVATPPTTSPPTTVATTTPTTDAEAIATAVAQPDAVDVPTTSPAAIDEGTTTRAAQLPTTGGRDQGTPTTVGLTLLTLGMIATGASTVRRRWVGADRAPSD